jgi:hypothetical protein
MKKLIQRSLVAPDSVIKAQFRFTDGQCTYYGVVTPKAVWYNYEYDSVNNYDFVLLPIPKNFMELSENEHIIYNVDDSKTYPFDEYKFSKITKGKLLDMFDQSHAVNGGIDMEGALRPLGYHYMVATPDGTMLCHHDQFCALSYRGNTLDAWYLISLTCCDVLMDINLKGAKQLFFTLPYTAKQPLLCHLEYGDYKVILTVACAKNFVNKELSNLNFKITADETGRLGKETIMSMREKLGNLKVFGETDVKEVIEAVSDSLLKENIENVVESASEILENAKESNKVIPMEESDRVIPMTVPQENVSEPTEIPSKNVSEPTEIPSKNVTGESETVANQTVEAPLTIDSLRYEFTELKTMVAMFDKHLREFAKTGSCSKKIQTELEKLRNENEKLREEVKKSAKAQEQLDKIHKYMASLQG